MFNVHLVNSRT